MLFLKRPTITFMMVVTFLSGVTNSFFWSSSSEPEQTLKPQLYAYPFPSIYHQRYIQAQQQIQQDQPIQQLPTQSEELSVGGIPAIPIQVPLQAQFSPIPNLHNVQLVPCLCPVSPNVEYEKVQEPSSRVL